MYHARLSQVRARRWSIPPMPPMWTWLALTSRVRRTCWRTTSRDSSGSRTLRIGWLGGRLSTSCLADHCSLSS
eukprot:7024497-Pyramimonas_sp.AAC.1